MDDGTQYGNRTATAKFNIWVDPEAASIVDDKRRAVNQTGLNVTHRFQASAARIAPLNIEVAADLGN